ncbi:TIGR02597 family protein [Prosthecobacter sp. SYSU 5D2]|uniref:TIGR02597 family protein n=1 Tax=Prosthecobacter sp. SYSU 5D2 TaxID=3134134 RepID=UPI0031FEFB27
MKRLPLLTIFALACSLHCPGQEISTPPVGFNSLVCPSGSDTYVSVSFNRPMAFLGAVDTAGGSAVTPQGELAWTANQFVTSGAHFVKFITGSKAGAFYEVTGNTGSALTLDLAGDSLSGVVEGDRIAVVPYWTLADLFPVGNQTIHQSVNTTSFGRRTVVLFPNLTGSGINLAPGGMYYQTSDGWKDALNGNASVNPRLEPDQYLIIRHRSQDAATTFAAAGAVDTWTVRSVLATQANAGVDNPVSNLRPVPVKLKDLELISSGAFVGSGGTTSFVRKDLLHVYDHAVVGINKIPSRVYFYNTLTQQWLSALESNRVADDDLILPASGFIIRKAKTGDGASSLWTHQPVTQ